MKKSRYIAAVCVFLTLSACTTISDSSTQDELTNRLILYGDALCLPPDWSFYPGNLTKGIVFVFRSPEGKEGVLEIAEFSGVPDLEWFVEYYEAQIFPIEDSVETTTLTSERYGEVSVLLGDSGVSQLAVLFAIQDYRIILLHYSVPVDVVIDLSVPLKILESYTRHDKYLTARERPNGFSFTSVSDAWDWVSDHNDGFLLVSRPEGGARETYAGFWSVPPEELELFENDETTVVLPDPVSIRIQGKRISPTLYQHIPDRSMLRIYGVFTLNEASYCMAMLRDESAEQTNIDELLSRPDSTGSA